MIFAYGRAAKDCRSANQLNNTPVNRLNIVCFRLVQQTQLTQQEFATTIGISIATLRHWERGDRQPQGAVLVLLNLVKKAPDTVLRILHE